MRLLLVAAFILATLALIASPDLNGTALGQGWYTWMASAFMAYFLDALVGGQVAPLAWRRPPPPH